MRILTMNQLYYHVDNTWETTQEAIINGAIVTSSGGNKTIKYNGSSFDVYWKDKIWREKVDFFTARLEYDAMKS